MAINKGDFVEVEYTGMLEDGTIFDTTDKAKAEKAELTTDVKKFGPINICIGEGHLIKGLDEQLINKELGEHKIQLQPEQAFGKKSAKLIQMIPTNKFKQQKINPVPGLQLNIDGMIATIKSVSAGRTLVDFNHPLSGRKVIYEIKINKKLTDPREKVLTLAKMHFQTDVAVKIEQTVAFIKFNQEIPKEVAEKIQEDFEKKVIALVKEVRGVKIVSGEQETKPKQEEEKEKTPK